MPNGAASIFLIIYPAPFAKRPVEGANLTKTVHLQNDTMHCSGKEKID